LIEKHIVLEDIDPVMFYGVNNGHLQIIKSLFPKLRITARDNVIRVLGDEEEMARFEEKSETLRKHILKYNANLLVLQMIMRCSFRYIWFFFFFIESI